MKVWSVKQSWYNVNHKVHTSTVTFITMTSSHERFVRCLYDVSIVTSPFVSLICMLAVRLSGSSVKK